MNEKIIDHILNQNTMLLDLALNRDDASLQAELDKAYRKHETDAATIRDLERSASILTNALDEASEQTETLQQKLDKTSEAHSEMRNILHQRDETIQHLTKQVEDLESKPDIHPEWEDINRFIDQAITHFDNPERSFQALTRAHLALQGKQPEEEMSA